MTEVVTNNDHVDVLHNIINNAKKFVIFACPFWYTQEHPNETVFSIFDDDIKAALNRDVDVLFICNEEFLERLQTYYRPLYIQYNKKIKVYSPLDLYNSCYNSTLNFHGKVYANESECLITSQNITGIGRSKDVGVHTDEVDLHMEALVWIGELFWADIPYKLVCFEDMIKDTYFGEYIEWYKQQKKYKT